MTIPIAKVEYEDIDRDTYLETIADPKGGPEQALLCTAEEHENRARREMVRAKIREILKA